MLGQLMDLSNEEREEIVKIAHIKYYMSRLNHKEQMKIILDCTSYPTLHDFIESNLDDLVEKMGINRNRKSEYMLIQGALKEFKDLEFEEQLNLIIDVTGYLDIDDLYTSEYEELIQKYLKVDPSKEIWEWCFLQYYHISHIRTLIIYYENRIYFDKTIAQEYLSSKGVSNSSELAKEDWGEYLSTIDQTKYKKMESDKITCNIKRHHFENHLMFVKKAILITYVFEISDIKGI